MKNRAFYMTDIRKMVAGEAEMPVSYTHLTLPTMRTV